MKNSGQQGVSLIIVLIMLGVIALTSAAALRSASSSERVGNNFRMQQLAFGYAEAALRYCETQVTTSSPFLNSVTLVMAGGNSRDTFRSRNRRSLRASVPRAQ